MDLTFLTPMAAIFAVSALLPLGIYWFRERRASGIRSALGLEEPSLRSRAPLVVAVAAVPLLLGIAAAQPGPGHRALGAGADGRRGVLRHGHLPLDAGSGRTEGATRFDRAVEAASAIHDRIPQVRSGIVSMTDRLLPTPCQRPTGACSRRRSGDRSASSCRRPRSPTPPMRPSTTSSPASRSAGTSHGRRRSGCSWC